MEKQFNQIKPLFVPYEIASEFKELGFDGECLGRYWGENHLLIIGYVQLSQLVDNAILAPLWQQALVWLFKQLDFRYPYLTIEIFSDGSGSWYQFKDDVIDELYIDFDNLEQAILKAIEICKQKS